MKNKQTQKTKNRKAMEEFVKRHEQEYAEAFDQILRSWATKMNRTGIALSAAKICVDFNEATNLLKQSVHELVSTPLKRLGAAIRYVHPSEW